MNALTVIEQSTTLSSDLAASSRLAADFIKASRAPNTLDAYVSDFRIFDAWCSERALVSLPPTPDTLCMFLADEASRGRRPSTLQRRLAAIKYAVEAAGVLADTEKSPTSHKAVTATLSGIRRTLGAAPKQKRAMTNDIVLAAIGSIKGDSLRAKRDRALLLLGFAMAARCSELTGLDVEDLQFSERGLYVVIRRSKTDQEGIGTKIAVVPGAIACPIVAVKEWMAAAGVTSGPLFRRIRNPKAQRVMPDRLHHQAVSLIVKAHIGKLGLEVDDFSAHSLRAGFLTSAANRGASIFKMRAVSRHKSIDVLSSYVRDADAFTDHAGAGLL
jgi:integrase